MSPRIRIDLFEYLRFIRVPVPGPAERFREQYRWCEENLVPGEWDINLDNTEFRFKHARDAVLFKLAVG